MSNKIATIVDSSKKLSSFENGTNLNIYYKATDSWQLKEEISYFLDTNSSLAYIRDYIRTVFLKLGDCNIVIGRTVSGLPYNILDRMGLAIFEADYISDSLLDEIFLEVQEYKNGRVASSVNLTTSPIQTEIAGIYFLDLIDLQHKHPEISSKKALQDFLATTPFYKLEVICSHVPPWFENFLPANKLTYSIEELEKSKYRVSIYKKVCEC
ncbi:MAG: Fe-only nitrogenase accessory AnfO family protein [Ruminiclostridium sp.]